MSLIEEDWERVHLTDEIYMREMEFQEMEHFRYGNPEQEPAEIKLEMETNEQLDKAIELTKKKVKLLEELKESLKYEQCKYHLVEHNDQLPVRYSLFEIGSQNNLCHGTPEKIATYIKLRNIDKSLIYSKP